jgi:isopenicillin N synthase-like dioxygenase
LYIGEELSPDDPKAGSFLCGPNLWPDLPEEQFRQPIQEYYQLMLALDHLLLKVVISGMPYAPDVLAEFTTDPNATLRLLHYPPQKSKDARQLGGKTIYLPSDAMFLFVTDSLVAGAHTDFGCITLLLQQPNQTGLQVLYQPTNSWIPVPAVENRFVVNAGDLLYGWTKGKYKSAVHRVINDGSEHRYSVPFFYTGNLSFKLRPLDGSEDEKAITVEQHVMAMYDKTYTVQ